jgi:hypothetical protein
MSGITISALPSATDVSPSDFIAKVDVATGVTQKALVSQFATAVKLQSGLPAAPASMSISSNSVIASPIPALITVDATTTGLSLATPVMNASTVPLGVGQSFVVVNEGDNSFDLTNHSGSTVLATLSPDDVYTIYVNDISSSDGDFSATNLTTSNIEEGDNLYYTDNRVQGVINGQRGMNGGLASLNGVGVLPTNQAPNWLNVPISASTFTVRAGDNQCIYTYTGTGTLTLHLPVGYTQYGTLILLNCMQTGTINLVVNDPGEDSQYGPTTVTRGAPLWLMVYENNLSMGTSVWMTK